MDPKVFAINLNHVFTGLRALGYVAIWAIFGAFNVESAAPFAIGSGVTELFYRGYKRLRHIALVRRAKRNVSFFKLDNKGNVVECTHEETEQQLQVIADEIRESAAGDHLELTKAPFYKHAHVGPVCMIAVWTGVSLKGKPVEPWDLILRLEGTGQERQRSFGSWKEVEAEFNKHETAFRKAASVLNAATKPPTLH